MISCVLFVEELAFEFQLVKRQLNAQKWGIADIVRLKLNELKATKNRRLMVLSVTAMVSKAVTDKIKY